ncbi:NAD(P)-binding protein [Atractiella rhizophila]|nr:NAD(P)-binding protein [Atractiella rhizophila]KAH8919992.1 NAD(P)-binding protein [Atractiella rhizophila]
MSFQRIVKSNALFRPASPPVSLFLGGTSGVGEGMATKLAQQTGGRAHIILLGRNEEKAKQIMQSWPKHEEGKAEFVKCDVADLTQVREVTKDLKGRLEKINFLVLSPGLLTMQGYTPTKDGLDYKLQLHYFSRFRFAYDLIDLVDEAAKRGEKASLISILDGAGRGGKVFEEDLGLEKNYSLKNAAGTAITYNDIMVSEFSRRYPSISAFHILPGFVWTPIMNGLPRAVTLIGPLFKPFARSIEQAAEWMWYRPWSSEEAWSKGAWSLNDKAELGTENKHVDERIRKLVWDFSVEVTEGKKE